MEILLNLNLPHILGLHIFHFTICLMDHSSNSSDHDIEQDARRIESFNVGERPTIRQIAISRARLHYQHTSPGGDTDKYSPPERPLSGTPRTKLYHHLISRGGFIVPKK